jgi:hypothetical protein
MLTMQATSSSLVQSSMQSSQQKLRSIRGERGTSVCWILLSRCCAGVVLCPVEMQSATAMAVEEGRKQCGAVGGDVLERPWSSENVRVRPTGPTLVEGRRRHRC